MAKGLTYLLGAMLCAGTAAASQSAKPLNNPGIEKMLASKGMPAERLGYEGVRDEIVNVAHTCGYYFGKFYTGELLDTKEILKLKGDVLKAYGSWYDAIRFASNSPEIDKKRFKQYSEFIEPLKYSFNMAEILLFNTGAPQTEIDNLKYFENKFESFLK